MTRLIASMLCFALASPGWSMLVPADYADGPAMACSDDGIAVQHTLEAKLLRARLQDLKYSQSTIDARLSRLSPMELHDMARQVGSMHGSGLSVGDFTLGFLAAAATCLLYVPWLLSGR